jgi:6-phosphogluconolactonase (cycloisomerase 2 family)
MYAYNKFLAMKEKYKDKCYKFELYDYNDSGYDILMNHNGFFIYGTDRHDDGNEIFSISSANPNSEWNII